MSEKIPGLYYLRTYIGPPDLYDETTGGIALWSSKTLKNRGYSFLRRVEIINERIHSDVPVAHYSNVYIWVKIPFSKSKLENLLSFSKDIFYDQNKKMLIVRSRTLDTCIAQATVCALYAASKVTYYDINNRKMLKTFYEGIKHKKKRQIIHKMLAHLVNLLDTRPISSRARSSLTRIFTGH